MLFGVSIFIIIILILNSFGIYNFLLNDFDAQQIHPELVNGAFRRSASETYLVVYGFVGPCNVSFVAWHNLLILLAVVLAGDKVLVGAEEELSPREVLDLNLAVEEHAWLAILVLDDFDLGGRERNLYVVPGGGPVHMEVELVFGLLEQDLEADRSGVELPVNEEGRRVFLLFLRLFPHDRLPQVKVLLVLPRVSVVFVLVPDLNDVGSVQFVEPVGFDDVVL